MLFIIIFFILPHFLTRQSQEKPKTLNIHSPICLSFFLPPSSETLKGETHLLVLSLDTYTHTHTHTILFSLSLSRVVIVKSDTHEGAVSIGGG